MTYKELRKKLNKLSEEELLQTATVKDEYNDEYNAVEYVERTKHTNVLDKGHFYLVI